MTENVKKTLFYGRLDAFEGKLTEIVARLQHEINIYGEEASLEVIRTDWYDEPDYCNIIYYCPETFIERDRRLLKEEKAALRKAKQKQTSAQKAVFKMEEARIAAAQAQKDEFETFLKLKEKYEATKNTGKVPANSTENMF